MIFRRIRRAQIPEQMGESTSVPTTGGARSHARRAPRDAGVVHVTPRRATDATAINRISIRGVLIIAANFRKTAFRHSNVFN